MTRITDLSLTALAPVIWGSTYLITTEYLPDGYPLTVAMLRALPAGIVLLLMVGRLPERGWWLRIFVLGGLNFSIFWSLLFVAAYHLPGGVAATVGAVQPLIAVFLAAFVLNTRVRARAVFAAGAGILGVALLVVTSSATLDPIGIAAGIGGAASMAAGTVLSRKWQPPVSLLTFTAWQLTAGGLLLLPVALWVEPPLPPLNTHNIAGFIYLGLIGAAATYLLWFRGVARIEPGAISSLGFLSPVTAVVLGWAILGENLTNLQITGALIVLASVWLSQAIRRTSTHKPKGVTT